MLEAVTSVLQTAPAARPSAEQVSNARSFAANPDKIQEAPRAPYISPYIYMDVNYDKAVLQIRDSETGDVIRQFPSETRLRLQSAQSSADEALRAQQQQTAEPQQQAQQLPGRPETTSLAETVQQEAPSPANVPPAGNAATAQQIAAFKTASTSAAAGNGGQVSLFA